MIAHGNIRKLAESFVKSSQDANVPFEDFLQGLLRDDGTQIQGIVLKASDEGCASIDIQDIWFHIAEPFGNSIVASFYFSTLPPLLAGYTRIASILDPKEAAEFRASHCDVEWINGDFSNFCFIRGDDVSMSNQQAGVRAQHFGEILGEMCTGNFRKFDANAELIPILRFLLAIQWHETHHASRRYGIPNIDDKIQMVMLVLGVNVSWDVNHLQNLFLFSTMHLM